MILWLRRGIASPLNFGCLLAAFLVFPFVVKWTDAFSFARIDANSPEHTGAFLKFAVILFLFEWTWFLIAWVGIRSYGKVSFSQLVGGKWNRWFEIFRDLGLGLLTFAILLLTGAFLQQLLARFQNNTAVMRSMAPQNSVEAAAFLALALTAGFVEEFVFRGYLQAQFTALTGNVVVASILQLLLFIQGHYFQGVLRLISVGVIGLLLTLVALWRKSLKPGIIGHALGDGLGSILFFLKRL
jgi:hypothetical protein